MNILSAENISKSYGERILFTALNFGLSKGDKVALLAANGAGKTTLLNIIADKDFSETGKISLRKGIKMSYLPQDPTFDESLSISEYIHISHEHVYDAIKHYQTVLAQHSERNDAASALMLDEASSLMDEHHAWDYDARLSRMLSRFGILKQNQPIRELSGGEKKRMALAIALLDEPDLLIMDEPTNHLDISMTEWLEKHLAQSTLSLLMVTHDRYFLDRICNNIFELSDGKIFHHKGNFEYFLEKKAEREENLFTENEKARQLLKKELEWLRTTPSARTGKSKARISAYYQLKEKANSNIKPSELKLQVKSARLGGKIMEIKHLRKNFDNKSIISDFNYVFKKGEKIGIIGPNGVGKTTLLDMIIGKLKPDSGHVQTGETVKIGYFTQKGIIADIDKRVIDVVKEIAEMVYISDGSLLSASQFLQHFMFPPAMQYTFVSKLSGGEKRRLYLLTVLIQNPNFLILDEPTNDLDLMSLNKLEEFLSAFAGCVILVSHDRYFLDKLADHYFIFEGGGIIRDYYGSYSEYSLLKEEEEKAYTVKRKTPPLNETPKTKKKLSYKEQNEYDALENEIEMLENEKKELEEEISSWNSYDNSMTLKINRISEVISLIETKTMRWMELAEKAE